MTRMLSSLRAKMKFVWAVEDLGSVHRSLQRINLPVLVQMRCYLVALGCIRLVDCLARSRDVTGNLTF